MEEALEGMETTRREGLDWREEVSGQDGCRAGNSKDSEEGWEKASVTIFWEPWKWTRLLVNSKMTDRCLC